MIRTLALAAFITLPATGAAAAQDSPGSRQETLLILHTNDLHDHVRPDYDGVGGLPFVAGFVHDVRSRRNDVLVVDAGDVAEKGDLVARKTSSKMVFTALSRIGYHAWAPGNHDHDFGVDALRTFTDLAGTDILCINLFNGNGELEFPASKIYEVDGVRVGVIGAIEPRDTRSLDLEGTARAMAAEASRLKPDTDIIVALVHISAPHSAQISKVAMDIDVFVSGHSHEAITEAIQVPGTGALIVQSGSYAENVGWLELELDLEDRRIVDHETKLVAMDHETIAPDLEMLEWVRRQELELAPEALEVVGWAPREITRVEVGYMAAEGIRLASKADVGFNQTEQVVRAALPAGLLDHNAVYRTGGERGLDLVEVELTGQEITNYLQLLRTSRQYQTQWSGFRATMEAGTISTDLEPHRIYRAVMPRREWETRFLRLFERLAAEPRRWADVPALDRAIAAAPIALTWTDAVLALLERWNAAGISITEGIRAIAAETGQEGFPVAPSGM